MGIEVINIGSAPNDGTGDSLRTSFTKSNNNFSYLNSVVSGNGIVSANSLTITGNVILGQPMSFAPASANLQYAGTTNGYVQIQAQNKSNGPYATTDYVATADNGTDTDTFIDMGITSSGFNYPGFNIAKANDGYLYVSGNTTTGGGNLIIATQTNRDIIFTTNGGATSNEIARFRNGTGLQIAANTATTVMGSGALQVTGGTSITGNANIGGVLTVSSGSLTTGVFAGTYSDGIIVDYLTGNGRITVGSNDGLNIYNGGLTPSALLTINSTGNVVATGTISTTANASLGNLTLSSGSSFISGNNFSINNVRTVSYAIQNNLNANTSSITANLNHTTGRGILVFDFNSNLTLNLGTPIVSGFDKKILFRNRAATTSNILLPTSYNNKASNVIPVSSNAVATIWLTATDTTAANVFMTVINN
jgi:hypothetical protein